VDERLQFVRDALSDRFTISALCARYGVSRRIGYTWLARFEAEGRRGLHNCSRAPHHCPHTIPPSVAELLRAERTAHPCWDARKLLKVLATRHPRIHRWPAASTAADLLARHGLVQKRRHRRSPSTRQWCVPRPPRRTTSGRRISKASSARGMAATA